MPCRCLKNIYLNLSQDTVCTIHHLQITERTMTLTIPSTGMLPLGHLRQKSSMTYPPETNITDLEELQNPRAITLKSFGSSRQKGEPPCGELIL